jgi:hypothetical protein
VGNPIIGSLQGMTKWIIGGVCALAGLLLGRLLPRKRRS